MFNKISIRTNILAYFIFMVGIVSLSLLGLQYYFSQKLAMEATKRTFGQAAAKITADVQGRDKLAKESLCLMEQYPRMTQGPTDEIDIALTRRIANAMLRNSNIYAIYTGHGNGDFFEVVNMQSSEQLHMIFDVPMAARWVVIRIYDTDGGRVRRFDSFDADFRRLSFRSEASDYRATIRPWYKQAPSGGKAVRSDPYLFSNLGQKGITFSKRVGDDGTVLALDFTLSTLNVLFEHLQTMQPGEIYMYGHDGKMIASSETRNGNVEKRLSEAIAAGEVDQVIQYDRDGEARLGMVVPLSQEERGTTWLGFSVDSHTMMKPYLEKMSYALGIAFVLLLLSLPLIRWMTSRIVQPIYKLMDENKKIGERRFDDVAQVKTNIVELDKLSQSLVGMAESIRAYQAAQKELMHSFIKLIADAIDAKSPYTGGHCKRVPQLAVMLAKEAQKTEEGPFASFDFEDAEAWEEFEMGAWLHDCGKITTPEYVVDKSTKLETIYNRIHEIRTRFEVVWRDIEIAYYERLLKGGDKKELAAWMKREHDVLVDDFTFVAEANMGGEFMSEAHQERIRAIAARTWTRHFDDRLGLSDIELMRYEGVEPITLPAEEPLLADRPEHRVERIGFDETAYTAQGFKLEVPELLYNYGELYNLCIEKGTLSEEERFKINEHVIMSIKMLETLPYPEHMARIPEYAGTHHETLDGRGYPRRLKESELSVPARIMAISDIFEALTASDRPYKKGKTLSEALQIMKFMRDDRHIDAELFELFLRSGVYLAYANEHLKAEQIDAVNVDAYLY